MVNIRDENIQITQIELSVAKALLHRIEVDLERAQALHGAARARYDAARPWRRSPTNDTPAGQETST